MERLTEYEAVGGHAHAIPTVDADRAMMRLAAYEDTGLTPGEVHSMSGEWCAMMSVLNGMGSYDRLRELAEADKEGRVVVLPCKVGDTAWIKDRAGVPRIMRLEGPDIRFICTDEDNLCMATCGRTGNGLCAYRIRNDGSDIGKTVFLTREEAEAALQEVQNAEYIEIETALRGINIYCRQYWATASAIERIVRRQPAADVVKVVRCKDCANSYESIEGRICSYGVCVDCIVPDGFFCGYGKREDGDDNAVD